MALVPFRKAHWDLLQSSANLFVDNEHPNSELADLGAFASHFHDTLNSANFPYNRGSLSYDTRKTRDPFSSNAVESSTRWLRSKLDPMHTLLDEVYDKGIPTGSRVAPWPSDDTKLTKSTMATILQGLHWAPLAWTGDETDTIIYGSGTITWIQKYYVRFLQFSDDGITVTNSWAVIMRQPDDFVAEIFPPNLISGVTLDWIIGSNYNNNIGYYDPSDTSGSMNYFTYSNWEEPNFYRALVSYPIEDDGTCHLTPATTIPPMYLDHTFERDGLGSLSGINIFTGQDVEHTGTLFALNFDNAEFI